MRILTLPRSSAFAKTGGLADVVGPFPIDEELGHEAVVVIPRYRGIRVKEPPLSSLTVPLGVWRFCSICEADKATKVRFFLVDYPDYFDREHLYQTSNQDYADNSERFAFLSLAALEFAKRAPKPPDIIHCSDWQSSLVPVYLKTLYRNDPFFHKTKTLLTIHNLAFQGIFSRSVLSRISLPEELFHPELMEFYGNVNFLKGNSLR